MRAFVVTQYSKDGIHATELPKPKVGNSDVLVPVSAASINPLDKMVRNGEFKQLLKYKTPFVIGHDVAGVVTQVGPGVRNFKVGDEVYARPATYASEPSPSTSRSTRTTSHSSCTQAGRTHSARGRRRPLGRAGRLADPRREGSGQARTEGPRPRRRRRLGPP